MAMLTPIIRAMPLIAALPRPIQWYFKPSAGHTNFVLLPAAAFLFGGAAVGVYLNEARTARAERRLNVGLAAAGSMIASAGYASSLLPSIYRQSAFWTSSPTFFFVRLGLVMLAVPIAFVWGQRGSREPVKKESPMEYFGRASLFVYWIHVEMVYGVMTRPLQRHLSLRGWAAAFVAFTIFLYCLVVVRDWIAGQWRRAFHAHQSDGGAVGYDTTVRSANSLKGGRHAEGK
jgi:fucose 4-O-acetylase-like acetyltransferase